MKKLMMFLVIIACCVGIGYVGYKVFTTKSIKDVEISGEMQTLYLQNTADVNCPNFMDAKIKVTYTNGTVEYINPEKNVTVTDFSTLLTSSGKVTKMKISYKNFVREVEYYVIPQGMYYVSAEEERVGGEVVSSNLYNTEAGSANQTKEILYFSNNGEFKYYNNVDGSNLRDYSSKSADEKAKGAWLLYDGKYINNYKYSISGNQIKVKLGDKDYIVSVRLSSTGQLVITANNSEFVEVQNQEPMEKTRTTKTLDFIEMLENGNEKANIASHKLVYVNDDLRSCEKGDYSYFIMKINSNISDYQGKILLKFNYTTPLAGNLINSVYVVADDSMIVNEGEQNTFSERIKSLTDVPTNKTTNDLLYNDEIFEFKYVVKNY